MPFCDFTWIGTNGVNHNPPHDLFTSKNAIIWIRSFARRFAFTLNLKQPQLSKWRRTSALRMVRSWRSGHTTDALRDAGSRWQVVPTVLLIRPEVPGESYGSPFFWCRRQRGAGAQLTIRQDRSPCPKIWDTARTFTGKSFAVSSNQGHGRHFPCLDWAKSGFSAQLTENYCLDWAESVNYAQSTANYCLDWAESGFSAQLTGNLFRNSFRFEWSELRFVKICVIFLNPDQ